MSKPIEQIAALTIGTVESVSPVEIKVLLEPNAPQTTALNTGVPTGFPRINGYVLMPNETGAIVGLVTWLGVERSQFPKRTGLKDFGLVDLPFPLRKISLTPLGTLMATRRPGAVESTYHLERGVSAFPCVGDAALLPTAAQLLSIIRGSREEDRRVKIGTSPLAANADVTVDPDKVFGRHLAVLGNTGSGKSCTVAGLIRWSLSAASTVGGDNERPNARFIILDPNGEYAEAFQDYDGVRRFQVSPQTEGVEPLVVPAWMWNSQEWCAFARAAPGVQRPLLLQALRDMRSGARLSEPVERQAGRVLRSYKRQIEAVIGQGVAEYRSFGRSKGLGNLIRNLSTDAEQHAGRTDGYLSEALQSVASDCDRLASEHWYYWDAGETDGYNEFNETELRSIVDTIQSALSALPDLGDESPVSEDAPIEFATCDFPDHLDQIGSEEPGAQTAVFLSTLTMRIRMILADRRLGPVVNPPASTITFEQWLEAYIGRDGAENGELAIIDLSLVSSDVLNIVIAVVARIVFEATQRYRKQNDKELPTVLVLEEAHTFVGRGSHEEAETPTPGEMCRHTFERIAREGRKFGLGLVLSSQRPSELSPTVLAQCNTFLLHRMVNDRDQELVGRLVPDNLGGLLKELPSLPTRHAILLGWAAAVPVLVEITELPEEQRPKSSDPKFWAVWTGQEDRRIDWREIVDDWTGVRAAVEEESEESAPTQEDQ